MFAIRNKFVSGSKLKTDSSTLSMTVLCSAIAIALHMLYVATASSSIGVIN